MCGHRLLPSLELLKERGREGVTTAWTLPLLAPLAQSGYYNSIFREAGVALASRRYHRVPLATSSCLEAGVPLVPALAS